MCDNITVQVATDLSEIFAIPSYKKFVKYAIVVLRICVFELSALP